MKAYVFCATTGRSGTGTLHKVLSSFPEVAAFHEPWPAFNGQPMIARNLGDPLPSVQLFGRKSLQIYRAAVGKGIYVETNHMFVKAFFEEAVSEFQDRLVVIHLRRPPVATCQSFLRLGIIPGSEQGNEWALDYNAPANRLSLGQFLCPGGPFDHPFYHCLWYWYEIEERIREYKCRYSRLKWLTLETSDFQSPNAVRAVLSELGIPYTNQQIQNVVGIRANDRPAAGSSRLSIEEAEQMHRRFLSLLADRTEQRETYPSASGFDCH